MVVTELHEVVVPADRGLLLADLLGAPDNREVWPGEACTAAGADLVAVRREDCASIEMARMS